MKKSDQIVWAIDHLPRGVNLPIPGRADFWYEFQINLSNSRGFSMGYWLLDADAEALRDRGDEASKAEVDAILDYLKATYGIQSYNFLTGVEFIRSEAEFHGAINRIYRFLRKHKLTKRRITNISKQQKFFSAISTPIHENTI